MEDQTPVEDCVVVDEEEFVNKGFHWLAWGRNVAGRSRPLGQAKATQSKKVMKVMKVMEGDEGERR